MRLTAPILASLATVAILATAPAHAARPAVPPGLRSWLLALESVPTEAQVRISGGPKVEACLDGVVRDAAETAYARHRALSFLGMLESPKATALLRRHLTIADPAMRATAAVAWATGPARRNAAAAWPELDRLLADPAPQVRASAARSLAFIADRKGAMDRVARARDRERVTEVQRALDRTALKLGNRVP